MSGNSGSGGNARDNRQRGNAAQLLEKYKSMARDSQLAGDRVQTEYYLQFADHYFRVLEEGRSRFEDQQQQPQQSRRNRDDDDDYDNDDEVSADGGDGGGDDEAAAEPVQRPQRRERPERNDRPERNERNDRPAQRERFAGNDRAERPDRPLRDRPQQGNANGNSRDPEDDGDERISLGVFPPAIGAGIVEVEEDAPKPRRRVRKPRADDDGEDIAPAA